MTADTWVTRDVKTLQRIEEIVDLAHRGAAAKQVQVSVPHGLLSTRCEIAGCELNRTYIVIIFVFSRRVVMLKVPFSGADGFQTSETLTRSPLKYMGRSTYTYVSDPISPHSAQILIEKVACWYGGDVILDVFIAGYKLIEALNKRRQWESSSKRELREGVSHRKKRSLA